MGKHGEGTLQTLPAPPTTRVDLLELPTDVLENSKPSA